jgi:magnesium chelatase family protein
VDFEKLSSDRLGEASATVRGRVESARKTQEARLIDSPRGTNGDMVPREVREHCMLNRECQALIRTASQQLGLSARAYHRVLKLGRTIADLAGDVNIGPIHLAEALQYQIRNEG